MRIFTIKANDAFKTRLVLRGDLIIADRDYNLAGTSCTNVAATFIKIAITIAATHELFPHGGDVVGAYHNNDSEKGYDNYVYIPQGYLTPYGSALLTRRNLYGSPPASRIFSDDVDRIVLSCGYQRSPYDLKYYRMWTNDSPCIFMMILDYSVV